MDGLLQATDDHVPDIDDVPSSTPVNRTGSLLVTQPKVTLVPLRLPLTVPSPQSELVSSTVPLNDAPVWVISNEGRPQPDGQSRSGRDLVRIGSMHRSFH
jgi:hypothetical protein